MKIPSLDDVDVSGRRVFVRADLNVPLADGAVSDDTRIRASLPTLERLRSAGARIVLASHLGRPKGKSVPALSLAPVAARLSELLGDGVELAPDCIGDAVKAKAEALGPGQVLLLENLRFHPEEEANDDAFSAALAELADVYVNDAFGTMHRAHASTAGMAKRVPQRAAGLLVAAELDSLGRLRDGEIDRPYVAILGGSKVSDKIPILERLIERVDAVVIGGAMAYTFLEARGFAVGASRVERDRIDTVNRLTAAAATRGVAIHLPEDHVVNDALDAPGEPAVVEAIPEGRMGLDIGPATRARYAEVIGGARTLLWNGPMGVFEDARYAEGTLGVARAMAEADAFTVAGGGDSVAALVQAGLTDRLTHVSTGGGASLEFLSGDELPGVAALVDEQVPD